MKKLLYMLLPLSLVSSESAQAKHDFKHMVGLTVGSIAGYYVYKTVKNEFESKSIPMALGASFFASFYYLTYQSCLNIEEEALQKNNVTSTNNAAQNEDKKTDTQDKTDLADLIGMDKVTSAINLVIEQIKDADHFKKFGVTIPKGVLLYGPPGSGKTMLARAVASSCNAHFLYASASSFVNTYVGTGSAAVRTLFQQATSYAQSGKFVIIFIDELDTLGSREDEQRGVKAYAETITELLTQLDGFQQTKNILVLAATNYKSRIDKALLRAGRFDRMIRVPLLDYAGRHALITHLKNTRPLIEISAEMVDDIAKKTASRTAADIKNIFNNAALLAATENATAVQDDHIARSMLTVLEERK